MVLLVDDAFVVALEREEDLWMAVVVVCPPLRAYQVCCGLLRFAFFTPPYTRERLLG